MENFKIEISSVFDKENLVAEIWYNEILVAELNQEKDNLEIEFYLSKEIKFDFEEFLKTLDSARKLLRKND